MPRRLISSTLALAAFFLVGRPAPAQAIPPGNCLQFPATYVSAQDGDTITVDVLVRMNLRLKTKDGGGCWAPELKESGGEESLANILKYKGSRGIVTIPMDKVNNLGDVITMSRILGDFYMWETEVDPRKPTLVIQHISDLGLAEIQIRDGHAARKKGGKPGGQP